jgi:hypothetical protein
MERVGAYCSGVVVSYRRDGALVVVDMGGGYGGPIYEHLRANHVECKRYKGAEATTRRSRDGKLRFTNKRSAALWPFAKRWTRASPAAARSRCRPTRSWWPT